MDEESATLSRTQAIAEDAVREIDRLILEAEVQHRESEKRYSIDDEAEDAMSGLVEVLERLKICTSISSAPPPTPRTPPPLIRTRAVR